MELTFKVKKDEKGHTILDEFANMAEITKYSSTEGIIDVDSAPDDALVNETLMHKEDDTDDTKVGVEIDETSERTITGLVWDDEDKNGIKNENEEVINDVIVQLIEVKNFGSEEQPKYLEYIWQETKSGSNRVDRMQIYNDVPSIVEVTNDVEAGTGEYKFVGMIPGNYIIRFIYGDGSTYDLTENTLKYNGQDYKSTIINDNANDSKAKDNEARRLETMAYSVDVDASKGV